MLQVKNLHVTVEGKEILKGLNLEVKEGDIHAIMGPNGSGKSTLANVLMGHPKYIVTSGEVLFNNEDILALSPNERAKKGIFLSFQYPKEIPGVTLSNFLRSAVSDKKYSVEEFEKLLREKMKLLNMDEKYLNRYLNEGFSGGEKKKAEILQLLVINPSFAILDETDSGLDIDALRIVAEGIKLFKKEKKSVLVITHYKRILDYLKPNRVSILKNGEITQEGDIALANELEENGYDQ